MAESNLEVFDTRLLSLISECGLSAVVAEERLRQTAADLRVVIRQERGGLTRTEMEIARLLAAGHTAKEIAIMRGASYKTITAHMYNLYPKLGVHNRAQLVVALARLDAGKEPRG